MNAYFTSFHPSLCHLRFSGPAETDFTKIMRIAFFVAMLLNECAN